MCTSHNKPRFTLVYWHISVFLYICDDKYMCGKYIENYRKAERMREVPL